MSSNSSRDFDYKLLKFEIESHNGETVDITNIFKTLSIYESVYRNFIEGEVIIDESINIIEKTPIVGGENVTIRYTIETEDTEPVEYNFKIYKIDNLETRDQSLRKNYTIYFASKQLFLNINNRLSRSFSKTKNSDIVKNISENILDIEEIDIETTKNENNFVVPNWPPFKTINHLASNSISRETGTSDFLFYENKNKFNFKTLASLKNQDTQTEFTYKVDDEDVRDIDLSKIKQLNITEIWDIVENMRQGVYGSTLYIHNMENKNLEKHEFDYEEESGNILNDRKLLNPEVETNKWADIGFYGKQPDNFYRNINQWKQTRRYNIEKLENFKTMISVPGMIERNIGDKVRLKMFSTSVDKSVNNDTNISGDYLITKIKHFFTRYRYQQEIQIQKDSFIKE